MPSWGFGLHLPRSAHPMAEHLFVLPATLLELCALTSYDMTSAVLRDSARGRTGTIRRAARPDAFRRYLIADAIGLALCLGVAVWAIASYR